MTLTVRKGSTILSPQMQVSAYYQYDFATRRAVRVIETIVPSINTAEVTAGMAYAADRYYYPLGVIKSETVAPPAVNDIGGTLQNWDATQQVHYLRFTATTHGVAPTGTSDTPFIYPTGVFGSGTSYAPKNANVTTVNIKFLARFSDNADYTTAGVGALFGQSNISLFDTAANNFLQVTRNSGNWELGSSDGSTISQAASSGGADGSWHEFHVEWTLTELNLYVDASLVVTKSTNLPARALRINAACINSRTIDLSDYLVYWS